MSIPRSLWLPAALTLALAPQALAGGPPAVDFELRSLSGDKVKLSAHAGKTILLFFVSDECGVCHEELPAVEEIARRYESRGLVVLGIVSHEPAPASSLRTGAFPMLLATDEMLKSYRIIGYPMHYIFDKDLSLQAKHRGYHEGREKVLEAEVRQVLGGEDLNEAGIDLYAAQGSWEGHFTEKEGWRRRTDQIIPMLNSADPGEREWAVDELGRRGAKDAVAMLGAILVSTQEDLALRRKVLAALVRIGAPDAQGSYLKVARGASEPELIRGEAVFALSTVVDGPGVKEALLAFLKESAPNLRLAAATVLSDRCVTEATMALEDALKAETNDWVMAAITRALGKLAECSAAPPGAPTPAPAAP
ncbi:MAG: HEAT repeat domain-containing protein [Acidobacteriota bacterium]